MKVPKTIRGLYDDEKEGFYALEREVRLFLSDWCTSRDWFFRTRIKELESFALKLESNDQFGKRGYEDFLGVEIIVNNREEIKEARILIESKGFQIVEQRPKDLDLADAYPEDFRFSELRLYAVLPKPAGVPTRIYYGKKFEIQVKTFLGYAWTKATHDLIYKAESYSWAKSRVAFQVRAMLEQAEYSISQIGRTEEAYFPQHTDYNNRNKIITLLGKYWPADRLPNDLKRLSQSITRFLRLVGSSVEELEAVLETEHSSGRGGHTLNLSPFFTIVQGYVFQRPQLLLDIEEPSGKDRTSIPVISELGLPDNILTVLRKRKRAREFPIIGGGGQQ